MRKCLGMVPALLLSGAALADPPPVHRTDVERRAQSEFDKADTNHDSILTREEYHAALARIVKARGGTPSAKGWQQVDAQFDAVDPAHTGRIPRAVFVDAALAHFDGADLNHDGTVTPGEARKAQTMIRKQMRQRAKAAKAAG